MDSYAGRLESRAEEKESRGGQGGTCCLHRLQFPNSVSSGTLFQRKPTQSTDEGLVSPPRPSIAIL